MSNIYSIEIVEYQQEHNLYATQVACTGSYPLLHWQFQIYRALIMSRVAVTQLSHIKTTVIGYQTKYRMYDNCLA